MHNTRTYVTHKQLLVTADNRAHNFGHLPVISKMTCNLSSKILNPTLSIYLSLAIFQVNMD